MYCGPARGRHTAPLIAAKLDKIINEMELPDDMFKAITTDNAANMLAATTRNSDVLQKGLGCVDHLLQIVINSSIKKVLAINDAVIKFKILAMATHRSTLASQRIEKACSDINTLARTAKEQCPYVMIHNPVDTRWNSLLMCIRSVCKLKPALLAIKNNLADQADHPALYAAIPTEEMFDLLDKTIPILSQFEAVSEFFSADSHPTICFVIPKIERLMKQCQSEVERNSLADEDLGLFCGVR